MKTKQSLLTQLPPPWPSQQRAAPPHWLPPPLPTKNSISLSQQSSSGGSSFPSAPYLCLWGGRTDCGCLQLAAAGTSLVGPHHHGTNTGDSARSRLPRLCCCCTPTHPGGGKRHVAILFYCNFLDFVLLFPYFNLWTLPSHFWLTNHHTHN